MKLQSFYLLLMALTFNSCIGYKQGATASGEGSVYESFFINDSTMQYFITPLKYSNEKEDLWIDFTFRHEGSKFTEVTANFSFHSPAAMESLELSLMAGETRNLVSDMKMLYKEKEKKGIHFRYTSKISYEVFTSFVKSMSAEILLKETRFVPARKTIKSLKFLSDNILDFI